MLLKVLFKVLFVVLFFACLTPCSHRKPYEEKSLTTIARPTADSPRLAYRQLRRLGHYR